MPKPSSLTREKFFALPSGSRSSRRKEAHFKCRAPKEKLEPRYLGCYDRLTVATTQFVFPLRKMISPQPALCYKRTVAHGLF